MITKIFLRMMYVVFLLFIGMKMQQYFDNSKKVSEVLTEKQKIALTARFVFMENCTSVSEQLSGQSKNSLFQPKEFMQLSVYCAKQAEKISKFILEQKDDEISSDSIVEVIDRAFNSVKTEFLENSDTKYEESDSVEVSFKNDSTFI